jgi:hypothetical protein
VSKIISVFVTTFPVPPRVVPTSVVLLRDAKHANGTFAATAGFGVNSAKPHNTWIARDIVVPVQATSLGLSRSTRISIRTILCGIVQTINCNSNRCLSVIVPSEEEEGEDHSDLVVGELLSSVNEILFLFLFPFLPNAMRFSVNKQHNNIAPLLEYFAILFNTFPMYNTS